MRFSDSLSMAVRGISSSKLRSVLTVLGVLIGVSAVIILVAFGTGSSCAVEARDKSSSGPTHSPSSTKGGSGEVGPSREPRPHRRT